MNLCEYREVCSFYNEDMCYYGNDTRHIFNCEISDAFVEAVRSIDSAFKKRGWKPK